ncbi:4-hydroxyphenylacetate 3-hydroxylase N-terminal domain-containing protein, partial [Bradyrhizobium sp.]|uniref:4-hydroxyphenylacetate 3-hydroxylase N-terminal domain-containing protein n=1 Tax=Bradyrhizobium sp. TaxID=376 RepID=UPI003C6FD684
MKTGEQHISGLRDGRTIFIGGERVDDVTRHHAFARSIASMGRLYDFAAAPENQSLMTYTAPDGAQANRIWELPLSYGDLVQRRRALEAWGGLHAGFMGRAPDHVASCIAGLYMGLDVFEAYD